MRRDNKRRKGHSVLEMTLMAPWLFFLFAGAFDFGMYANAFISVENAARVAAMRTSANTAVAADSAWACQAVLPEMNSLPNAKTLSNCAALPLTVTATQVTGSDGSPASRVSVTYRTVQLIPIPGLSGLMTITRTAQMRVRG
jgi:Flp pilus assembly protein TadG